MKVLRLLVLAMAMAMAWAAPWAASAQVKVTLKNGNIGYEQGGIQKVLLAVEEGGVTRVQNSDVVFVYVEDAGTLQAAGHSEPGLFFFDKNGALAAYFPGGGNFDPAMCATASMSPNGKIIALDNGTWLVRIWAFYNFPAFTPLTTEEDPFISYLTLAGIREDGRIEQDLTWLENDAVIVTDLSETPVARPCQSDPCEPTDVVIHRLSGWKAAALAKGDELCDYRFNSLAGDVVTVDKVCVKSLDDWQDPEKTPTATREKLKISK